MGDCGFPITEKPFLFKFIEWIIALVIFILMVLDFYFLPYPGLWYLILFSHTVPAFMVILCCMMVLFMYKGDENKPKGFSYILFTLVGAILYTTCGVLSLVEILSEDHYFRSYGAIMILILANGIIFIVDFIINGLKLCGGGGE